MKYDRYTKECKQGMVCVYGWSTYPESSVLAGQPLKQFLDGFQDDESASAAYPAAEWSNAWVEPPRASVPPCPPSDFDPGYCGERWDED